MFDIIFGDEEARHELVKSQKEVKSLIVHNFIRNNGKWMLSWEYE